MGCIKATINVALTLEADNFSILKWHIDTSFVVHLDMRGLTGGGLMLGKCSVFNESTKQKINGESDTETEIIGVNNMTPQVMWTKHFCRDTRSQCKHNNVSRQQKCSAIKNKWSIKWQ